MFSDWGSTSGQINPGAYFACRSSKIKPQKDASITLLLLTPVVSPTELAGDSVLSKFVSIAFFAMIYGAQLLLLLVWLGFLLLFLSPVIAFFWFLSFLWVFYLFLFCCSFKILFNSNTHLAKSTMGTSNHSRAEPPPPFEANQRQYFIIRSSIFRASILPSFLSRRPVL